MDRTVTRKARIKEQCKVDTAKLYILMGTSIVTSMIIFKLMMYYEHPLNHFFGFFSGIEKVMIGIGFIMIIEGVYFCKQPKFESIKRKYLNFCYSMLAYVGILFVIWRLHYIATDTGVKSHNPFCIYILLFIFCISLLWELNKFIKALYRIFNNSKMESKDKLTITIAIIGTVIAAIALLK